MMKKLIESYVLIIVAMVGFDFRPLIEVAAADVDVACHSSGIASNVAAVAFVHVIRFVMDIAHPTLDCIFPSIWLADLVVGD